MSRVRGLRGKRKYSHEYRPADNAIQVVAQVVEMNPELVKGYLTVAILIDGSQAIAHNACCLPHLLNTVTMNMVRSPELMRPHRDHSESHTP